MHVSTHFSLFPAAALLLAAAPGPGLLYVASRTLAGGHAEGVASSMSAGLGGFVHLGGSVVGVSALVLASATLVSVLFNRLADLAVSFTAGVAQAGARTNAQLVARLRVGSVAAMIALGCGLLLKQPAR